MTAPNEGHPGDDLGMKQRRQRVGSLDPFNPVFSGRHGLSSIEVTGMFNKQGRRCASCANDSPGPGGSMWAVDHDHVLAAFHNHDVNIGCRKCVTGVVCQDCNVILGYSRDLPDRLRAAAAFMDRILERRNKEMGITVDDERDLVQRVAAEAAGE